MTTLAASSLAGVIAWSAALLALLAIGLVAALRLKRRLNSADDEVLAPAAGFSLSDLRQMHRAGQLTDEEFAKARDKVVVAAKKAAEREQVPGQPADKNSPDAIRARRLAREAQDFPSPAPGGHNPNDPSTQ